MRALVVLHGTEYPFADQTWTDLGGRFKFKNIPAGTYTLSANVPRLGRKTLSVDVSASFADSRGRVHQIIHLESTPSSSHQISVAELSISKKAWKLHAKAQQELSRGRVQKATSYLKKALKLAPKFTQALNNLGTIAYQTRHYEEARQYFRQALETDPSAYSPLVNLGGALLSLQRFQEALKVNRDAVRQRSEDPLANSQLGLTFMALGRDQEALKYLLRARQLEPGHFSYPQLSLARIYWRLGQPEAATKVLREFLRLHPDSPEARTLRQRLEKPSQ